MGQKVGALSFRLGISVHGKIKVYPLNNRVIMLKKYNIFKIIQSFLVKMKMELMFYKSFLWNIYIIMYIYIFRYHKYYKRLKLKKYRKKFKKNKVKLRLIYKKK